LKWDLDGERSDPDLAHATARYQCEHCRKEIHDDQRRRLMRSGNWAPAGQRPNKRGKLVGTPKRQGTIWTSQLSSLYSLQLRWGDVAKKFVESSSKKRRLQMFINGWMAETFEPYKARTEPDQLAERLCLADFHRGTIPLGFTWLVGAIDVQDTFFVCT